MDENEEQILDSEYKRYLEIMRPYLGQLLDQDVIEICNAWIQRLSDCKPKEKVFRNKYIFSMCYQLARGILEEPFLQNPTSEELTPLQDGTNTDDSNNESSEVEYLALDLNSTKTKVIFNKSNKPATEISHSSEFYETDQSKDCHDEQKNPVNWSSNSQTDGREETVMCYDCPIAFPKIPNIDIYNDTCYNDKQYEYRVNNLIMKLREIKMQNLMLHNELITLRENSRLQHKYTENLQDNIIKVDNSTSVHIHTQESATNLNCLKSKLQEVQDSRNSLIETISNLQEKLDNFNDMKKHEIDDLLAQHRLEIIQVKASIREELKASYEKKVEELKQYHEQFVKDIQSKHVTEIENIKATIESTLAEKDKTIQSMETESNNLKKYIEGLKSNQFLMFSNFLDHSNKNLSPKCMSQKTEELERRLNKMEKAKIKCLKAYELKLANLQKDKHLAECSLQLQLMKQRAQVLNETADEHQTELATALDKLEGKYKDIVANVQATAVQRRIQDQMALESIIQTVCGVRNEGLHCNIAQATYTDQLSNKAVRTQARDANRSCDNELPTIIRDNKVGSVIVGNKAFADDSVLNGYCLDSEKFSELFERVCVPQRDTSESSPKN